MNVHDSDGGRSFEYIDDWGNLGMTSKILPGTESRSSKHVRVKPHLRGFTPSHSPLIVVTAIPGNSQYGAPAPIHPTVGVNLMDQVGASMGQRGIPHHMRGTPTTFAPSRLVEPH